MPPHPLSVRIFLFEHRDHGNLAVIRTAKIEHEVFGEDEDIKLAVIFLEKGIFQTLDFCIGFSCDRGIGFCSYKAS